MEIKAVVFDFFGVICSEVADKWFQTWLPDTDISKLRQDFVVDADLGNISFEEMCIEFAKLSGKTTEQVTAEWYKLAVIDIEMISLIKFLKERYQIGLCSNAPCDYLQTIIAQNALNNLFDAKTISCEIGVAKPDKRIFENIIEQLGLSPAEALFIDDNKLNVETATEMGIHGHHYIDVDTLRLFVETKLS